MNVRCQIPQFLFLILCLKHVAEKTVQEAMHIEAIQLLRAFHIQLKNKLRMKMNFLTLRTDSPRIKIHLK